MILLEHRTKKETKLEQCHVAMCSLPTRHRGNSTERSARRGHSANMKLEYRTFVVVDSPSASDGNVGIKPSRSSLVFSDLKTGHRCPAEKQKQQPTSANSTRRKQSLPAFSFMQLLAAPAANC